MHISFYFWDNLGKGITAPTPESSIHILFYTPSSKANQLFATPSSKSIKVIIQDSSIETPLEFNVSKPSQNPNFAVRKAPGPPFTETKRDYQYSSRAAPSFTWFKLARLLSQYFSERRRIPDEVYCLQHIPQSLGL
jgi:hypothetical protein